MNNSWRKIAPPKWLIVLILAQVLAVPIPSSLDSGKVAAQSTSYMQIQRNRAYQDMMRRREMERQRATQLRREQEALRRKEIDRQRKLRDTQSERAREAARALQKKITEKQLLKERELVQRRQADRSKQQRDKRTKNRNNITLAALFLSRMQIRSRLSQLSKPDPNVSLTNKRVTARTKQKRTNRPKFTSIRGKCSFHGDTLVLTDMGKVPIRDIRAGQHLVWAMDEFTGETGWKDVLAHYSNEYEETVHLSIFDPGSGTIQTIRSNRIHPFFVGSHELKDEVSEVSFSISEGAQVLEGDWIAAEELEIGQLLYSSDRTWDVVAQVRLENAKLAAFNLTIDEFHTYFVATEITEAGIWVHNECIEVESKINQSAYAIRQAQRVNVQAQSDIDKLQLELKRGNIMNAGIGTRNIGKYFEMRGSNNGRMIVARVGETKYEIVGKFQGHRRGDNANSAVIKRLISEYEKQN